MSITAFTPDLMRNLRAAGYNFYCAREYREVNHEMMLFVPFKNLKDALMCFNGLEENKTNKLYLYDDVIGGDPVIDQKPHSFFIELPKDFTNPTPSRSEDFHMPRPQMKGHRGLHY